jgi:hypothetical protein
MIIDSIGITNFRCFKSFSLQLDGNSIFLVSENATGKTSLLSAITKALGKDKGVTLADFGDPAAPIEIILRLSGFERADQGAFPKELSFTGKAPSLAIGFRAEWNVNEEEANTLCGFPDHGWKAASREQRDALRVVWLPAYRDPARLLQMGANRGFWAKLFATMNIDASIHKAIQEVETALKTFTGTQDMGTLLGQLRDALATLIPEVDKQAFSLGFQGSSSERDLLGEFEVLVSHGGPSLPIQKQSNGLIQLAVFVFALKVIANDPKAILLVDEPEISLHPQAQRSLSTACRKLPNQSIIATHSPSILDRADMRGVVRLHGSKGAVTVARAAGLSNDEASRLARFVNPLTAEACFARKVVLVEGYSDRVALLHLANRLNRDLDAEGVSIIAMDGGGAVGTYLRLFGQTGLKLKVLGLCDEDQEANWLSQLQKAGIGATDRVSMKAAGFMVCVKDLEQEFVRALGLTSAQAITTSEGEAASFTAFQKQPAHSTAPLDEQLRRFFQREKIRWAVPLVEGLNLKAIPGPLNDLITQI